MWWLGQQDSRKGAWDADVKGNRGNRNRRAGIGMMLRGFICLVIFVIFYYTLPFIATVFEGNAIVHNILFFISFGLPILALTSLQIPIGLYYFIRYYKIKD